MKKRRKPEAEQVEEQVAWEASADAAEAAPLEPEPDVAPDEQGAGDAAPPVGDEVPEAAVPSPEEELRRERDALQEKWLRVVAELDNVRKRSRREVGESRRLAQAEVLRAFLDLYDNFERALQAADGQDDTETNAGLRAGIELVFQNFQRILRDRGVEVIAALDAEFDPALHEAVGQLAREGVESGIVVEILQQGFTMGDFVLRPARVMISS